MQRIAYPQAAGRHRGLRRGPPGLWLFAGPVAAAVLLTASAAVGQAATPASAPAAASDGPGQLAKLPDRRVLNIRCQGEGTPTVILESGFGADSRAWPRVQPRIAKVTRVCTYDRAGYGFSDPGPLPRDGEAIARDLDRGLRAANIRGPFVLVGHSAGGLYIRLFAARRPAEVVGLVFLDPSTPFQTRRMAALLGRDVGGVEGIERRVATCLQATQAPPAAVEAPALLMCAPPTLAPDARRIALRPATWQAQLSEIQTLFVTTSEQVARTGDLLKGVPAVVLTASPRPDGVAAGPDDPGAAVWQQLHHDLAGEFERGDQRLIQSSHLIMKDRPEVVADVVIQMVEAARKR